MATKISKKQVVNAQGTLDINGMKLEVEGVDTPVQLSDLLKDFDGLDVKFSVTYGEDIA
ncbi:MAG: hypothetical protein PHN69_08280 [Candidatus Pacebacteria bacterium]|nr:hypothetical protein [Candidatus Paceibacterota bacterium]